MVRSYFVLLILSFGLLATGIPYGGVKGGSKWRYQQKTEVVQKEPEDGNVDTGGKDISSVTSYGVDKKVDADNEVETYPGQGDTIKDIDIGYESGSDQGKPDSDYSPTGNVDNLGPNYPYLPGKPKDSGFDPDYVPDKPNDGTGSDYVPDKPFEGSGSDYIPDKPYDETDTAYVPDKPYDGTDPDFVPDKPYEGTDPDFVPDKPYDGTDPDFVPDKPYEGAGSDYVPDKPNEGTGSDYVPNKPYEGTGSDYVPDRPNEGTGSDYVPDKAIPDYEIGPSYLPPEEIYPEGNDNDYVPDKVTPLEGAGSDYVPKDALPHGKTDTNFVPDQGIEDLEEEIDVGYEEPEYKGTHKGSVQEESYGKGSDHYQPEKPEEPWLQKLKNKWNQLGASAKEVAESVGRTFDTAVEGIEGHFNSLWHKFKKVLTNFGYEIQRGARYVFTVISTSVEEVKASALIEKLEQRLEQGNEIVDEFFQKVGQKMTHWAQQHNHEKVDEGLWLETQQSKDNNFLDVFQDKEIHTQVEKMVSGGVITQEEADLIFQIKQTKVEETLDGSSHIVPNQHGSSGYSSNVEGNIEFGSSGASYGAEGKVDHAAYDNQDAKPHHTTKKELEGHTDEQHGKDQKTINFPVKG